MPWVIWVTGLPGSGKSTIALRVKKKFPDAVILSVDELRKIVTPKPTYTQREREYVYRSLVFTALTLYRLGHNVIIDATAHKKAWRNLARQHIPEFFEIYLHCPVKICMDREQARINTHAAPENIYEKGKKGWPVPGMKVRYEEPDKPDIFIDTHRESAIKAAEKIVQMLEKGTDEKK
jgi:adenylylsulfate kinase